MTLWDMILLAAEKRLIDSGWTQLPDSGLSFVKQTEWLNYRIALKTLKETF